MKVSIAMTTFNGEKFLNTQLESILKQTVKPDELIVCDDCSTDRTLEILKDFKQKVSFEVKIYENKKNIGFTKNFEKVIGLCNKDLIFISDQDDFWFPNKIEFMRNFFMSNKECFVAINNAQLTDMDLNPSEIFKLRQVKNFSGDDKSFIAGCCTVIKRELLETILPISKRMAYDSWIHFVGTNTNTRLIISETLQYYRIHDKNTSKNPVNTVIKINKRDRYIKILKRLLFFQPNLKRSLYNKIILKESLILKKRLKHNFELAGNTSLNLIKMKNFLEKKVFIYKLTYFLQNKKNFKKFTISFINLFLGKINLKEFLYINF